MMITRAEIVPMLIEACPTFLSEDELPYVSLGDFARHLLELHRRHETETFPAVAWVIERFLIEGDDYVREAATIGLLEGIQNVWGNNDVDPEEFTPHLLPESRRWWIELNAFWRGERRYVGEGIQQDGT